MKYLILIGMITLSFSAFAQESVVLDDVAEISTNYNPVYLDVVENTPSINYLNIKIERSVKTCLSYELKEVFEQNVEHCGYEFEEKTICSGNLNSIPGVDYQSDTELPSENRIINNLARLFGGPSYEPSPISTHPRCRKIEMPVVKSCYFNKEVCAELKVEKVIENRKLKLILQNFIPNTHFKLGLDSDENLDINVYNYDHTCINKTIYKKDSKVTGLKLKIKNHCRPLYN